MRKEAGRVAALAEPLPAPGARNEHPQQDTSPRARACRKGSGLLDGSEAAPRYFHPAPTLVVTGVILRLTNRIGATRSARPTAVARSQSPNAFISAGKLPVLAPALYVLTLTRTLLLSEDGHGEQQARSKHKTLHNRLLSRAAHHEGGAQGVVDGHGSSPRAPIALRRVALAGTKESQGRSEGARRKPLSALHGGESLGVGLRIVPEIKAATDRSLPESTVGQLEFHAESLPGTAPSVNTKEGLS
jgi:hypothetical protein